MGPGLLPTLGGGGGWSPIYDFAKKSEKLHEIEKFWTIGGGEAPFEFAIQQVSHLDNIPLPPPLSSQLEFIRNIRNSLQYKNANIANFI